MKLDLSPAALEDIRSITAYTLQTWGDVQADRYLEAVWGTLEDIRRCPDHFRLRPELVDGCRSALVGRHVILFCVNNDLIAVLRILHASMDFQQHL